MVAPAAAAALVAGLLLASSIDDGPARESQASRLATSVDSFGAPQPLAPGESVVDSAVQANGDVVVQQWIHADEPLERLGLSLPEDLAATGTSASDVEVLVNGSPVEGPDRLGTVGATYAFSGTTQVRLRYRLSGVVQRSDSASGRALAVTTTLQTEYEPRVESETRLLRADGSVLGVACAASLETSPTPCGSSVGQRWQIELVGAHVDDRVLAQLDTGPVGR